METYKVARETTTPGYRPECTAPQTKAAADYDSWSIHTHTLRRVRCRKEHSLITAAVQRRRGNAALLLWFYWLQAWNITLPPLIAAQCPLGLHITHVTMTLPNIMPCSWASDPPLMEPQKYPNQPCLQVEAAITTFHCFQR